MILVNKGKGNDFWIDENGIMRSRDLRTIFWWSSTNKDSTFMDLVSGLPRTPSTYEVVWVIMDERTRFVYFVPYRTNCSIVAIIRVRSGIVTSLLFRCRGTLCSCFVVLVVV